MLYRVVFLLLLATAQGRRRRRTDTPTKKHQLTPQEYVNFIHGLTPDGKGKRTEKFSIELMSPMGSEEGINRQMIFKHEGKYYELPERTSISPEEREFRMKLPLMPGGPSTQEELVAELHRMGYIKSMVVAKLMNRIDRFFFDKEHPYGDFPEGTGFASHISSPHMHAFALEMLRNHLRRPGARALDVDSSNGYLTTCMAMMIGPSGYAVGVESLYAIYRQSMRNVMYFNPRLLALGQVKFYTGNASMGSQEHAPFDAIYVQSACEFFPEWLARQLKPGGRLIACVGESGSRTEMTIFDKNLKNQTLKWTKKGIYYVPRILEAVPVDYYDIFSEEREYSELNDTHLINETAVDMMFQMIYSRSTVKPWEWEPPYTKEWWQE